MPFFHDAKGYIEGIFIEEHQRKVITQNIYAQAEFDKGFFLLIVLSSVIATAGLITNNNAVVIGAMIIAPLMWPILGVGMGTVKGDIRSFFRHFFILIFGVFLAFFVSALTAYVIPFTSLSNEILKRVNPSVTDLIIALASGIVAALSVAWPKFSNVIAGVAVAASLLPPLCVTGIALTIGNFDASYGALLLFLANILAILLSSVVVFWFLGFKPRHNPEERVFMALGLVISFGLFLLFLIPLSYFIYDSLERELVKIESRDFLKSELIKFDHNVKIRTFLVEDFREFVKIETDILFPAENVPRFPLEEIFEEKFSNIFRKKVFLELNIIPIFIERDFIAEKQGNAYIGRNYIFQNIQEKMLHDSYGIVSGWMIGKKRGEY